ncbi:signal peptidase I [Candidatus Roizmanbacteria bacterium CG_4_10_14_0_2_um_filter_36_9]|uniref:Signal peptidase I n=2 Tax=Candidatus Roizmaniibacteriota TaxID=1752723 RepID=A0A2M7U6E1_9BACT|nr:MAG: signal peptidase I [Candidatus Roizmanbacteria bacterium CG_4_10_14_0_2_um_filter_36_9]
MPRKSQSLLYQIFIWPLKTILFVLRISFLTGIIIAIWYFLQIVGIFTVRVPVSGASMLPTFPEEGVISFQRYYSNAKLQKYIPQTIQHGDVVVFENKKTHEELKRQEKDATGFVKRAVGLPGDTVLIENGYVYVNGKKIKESYILKPRSTYGSKEVKDCQPVKVPDGKVFVLGDNRKISMDTRQIGLVSFQDIKYYIPFEKQLGSYDKNWRDTTDDFTKEHDSLFDVKEYTALLNDERKKNGLAALKYEPKLEDSASRRAKVMLKFDEFESSAPKSGYSMKDAMTDAGYSNITYGEFPMLGYYDAQELFEAFLERPGAKEFLLNEDYDDIGVSTFVGELNNCPVQIVIQHLAGYIPPNYGSGEITSWEDGLNKLKSVQTGWSKLKDYEEFYTNNRQDVDRINEIINLRTNRFTQIISRMKANEWLTTEERGWIEQDKNLSDEQNRIADNLNK